MLYQELANQLLQEYQENQVKAAQALLNDVSKTVPVDTGELQSSGRVIIEDDNTVSVVYDAEHAIYVHEIPTHTGYKFLEKTVNQNYKKYTDIISEV